MTTKAVIAGNTRSALQTVFIGVSQKIAIGETSTQSAALGASTDVVRLFPTKDCWVKISADPTAEADDGASAFLPGGILQWFLVIGGQKIAVIRDSENGYLHILEGDSN